MTEFSKIYILAEDVRQQRFVRRYLYNAGFEPHAIDAQPVPEGVGGAGEHWVRQHYAAFVKKYRRRAATVKTALIVVIDADTEEITRRSRQLEEALRQAGVEARARAEAIVHFIPKRHIETWIQYLSGVEVDEVTDYHREDLDDSIPAAAATFHEWIRQPPVDCPPSLLTAIEETRRLA